MKKQYSDDFKADALNKLDANGGTETKGAISLTADQMGVPRSTFVGWISRSEAIRNRVITTQKDDAIAQLRDKKRGILIDELRTTSFVLLALGDEVVKELKKKIPTMETDELIKTMRAIGTFSGISLDKVARLEAAGAGAGKKLEDTQPGKESFFSRAFPTRKQEEAKA